MNKYISWNIKRRDVYYWIALGMLIITTINASSWSNIENPFAIVLRDKIYDLYNKFFPYPNFNEVGYILCNFFVLIFCMFIVIVLFNQIVGQLTNFYCIKSRGLFSLFFQSAFLGDFVIGIFLEISAVNGLIQLYESFEITSITIWIYIMFFLLGSSFYWKSTLLLKQYREVKTLLKDNGEYEDRSWYCISNSKFKLSTFKRIPWKGKITEIIVDYQDISAINDNIKEWSFINYLIVINQNEEISELFRQKIEYLINIPHSKVLVLLFGKENENKEIDNLIYSLIHNSNVVIEDFGEQRLANELNIEQLISPYRKQGNVKIPLRFIENEQLIQTYLNFSNGPQICLDFLRAILYDLEIFPAIYALFDLIDLQYRITIAYEIQPNYRWMKKKSRIIGNIGIMGNIIKEKVIKSNIENGVVNISIEKLFTKILTNNEKKAIYKYLPNYNMDEDCPIYDTIRYLISSLRNVLRGHGSFEAADANVLFELVFKLVLINTHVLSINNLSLRIDSIKAWSSIKNCYFRVRGEKKGKEVKQLSPFIVSLQNGTMYVFNNLVRGEGEEKKIYIEYINYLNGRLMLIEMESY